MKKNGIFLGLLILSLLAVIGVAQENSTPNDGTTPLSLLVTDLPELRHFSDKELEDFLKQLAVTPQIPFAQMPRFNEFGGYFSLQHPDWPPLPGNINHEDAWRMEDFYLLNDMDFDYNCKSSSHHAKTSSLDPADADGSDTNTYTYESFTAPDYGTNLWIAQPHLTNNFLAGIGTNTMADVQYEIQSRTNLVQTDWQSEGFILGSEVTNWTPLSVAQNNRTNLFLRLRSWQDDGSGLPIWWQQQYFGTNGVDPYGNPAGDGWSNLQKFQNGWNPTNFYTPAAPRVSAALNNNNHHATVSWLFASGVVTNYVVTKSDFAPGVYSPYFVTNFNVSPETTSLEDDLTGEFNVADSYDEPTALVNYSVVAQYARGNSAPGSASVQGIASPSVNFVTGPQGNLCCVFQNLPTDLMKIRVFREQSWALDFDGFAMAGDYAQNDFYYLGFLLDDGFFDIPASNITNGICTIPTSQLPPYSQYALYIQTVRSNGLASGWTVSSADDDYFIYPDNKPLVDTRVQLKDNLRFLLRSPSTNLPFAFKVVEGSGSWELPPLFVWRRGYVCASYYASGAFVSDYFDVLRPIHDNCFYRNFVFNQSNLKSNGFPNTGIYGPDFFYVVTNTTQGYWQTAEIITNFPSYYFDLVGYLVSTNPTVPSSQITSTLSQWILPTDGSAGSLTATTFSNGLRNCYGLPFVSVKNAYVTNGALTFSTTFPGQKYPGGVVGTRYIEIDQPVFQNAGYYFARPGIDPMPETTNFITTNATRFIMQGVGTGQKIAGYEKFAVSNGYSNTLGYLGQLFAAAYKINTNGNITTNTTGVLSPYGDFFATEPGDVALVTMPDIDTGAQGTCVVHCVSLQVDKNHDGVMDFSFTGADATSQANPMQFWVNRGHCEAGINGNLDIDLAVPPATTNYLAGKITCQRDLENCARLWLNGIPKLTNGQQVTLSWNVAAGNPAINLYWSSDSSGGIGYLTDTNVAAEQSRTYMSPNPTFGISLATIKAEQSFTLPENYFDYNYPYFSRFLFEGAGIGSGELLLTITDSHSNTLAQTGVWLNLRDVKEMYQRVKVTPRDPNGIPGPWLSNTNTFNENSVSVDVSDDGYGFNPPADETKTATVFVHGSNISAPTAIGNAETMFKRLYWQGYNGRFVLFYWNTLVGPWDGTIPAHYNYNEFRALKYGLALKSYVENMLPTNYAKNVIGHSMGNMVVTSALYPRGTNAGMTCRNVIMMQAAVPASCFDPNAATLPLLTGMEAVNTTPDMAPLGYRGLASTNIQATIYNIYNTNDFALGWWDNNQVLTKPEDLWHPISYWPGYYTNSGSLYKWANNPLTGSYTSPGPLQRTVSDPQESISFIARSRTEALGRMAVGGSVVQNQNVGQGTTVNFGNQRSDHSGEFTRPIQQVKDFYKFLFDHVD